MRIDAEDLAAHCSKELLRRNVIFEYFFDAQNPTLAETCHEMSWRFLASG